MGVSEHLQAALGKLNAEQREAVECLDGPLLVIAGPGTGKTQLLSLRAANILAKRDVAPETCCASRTPMRVPRLCASVSSSWSAGTPMAFR